MCVVSSFPLLDCIVAHMAELSWSHFTTNIICTYLTLTRTNEYARSEIRAALGTNDAPAYKTRRFFDLINQRVKDTLKLQAQNIWITSLISEHQNADDGTIARLFYAEHKKGGRIPSKIPVPTAAYIKMIHAAFPFACRIQPCSDV